MADLLITTANTQIEEALQSTILLALGKRITVATNTALKALASAALWEDQLVYSTAAGYTFRFNRYSTTADNGTTVLAPTDAPTAGRWARTASTSSSGYLRDVALYEGEVSEDEIVKQLFGKVPSVLIVWVDDTYAPKSQVPGALYSYTARYEVWGISRNLRREQQAKTGSQIASESTKDPGAYRILGDLRSALAGSDLDQDGVDYVEILSASRVLASKVKDRQFIYKLDVEVRASIHNPESDLVALADPRAFDVYRQLADLHGDEEYDADNYIVSGISIATIAAGLTQSIASGSAIVDGDTETYAGQSKLFTASKDTYRDLKSDGTLRFTAVDNNADEPTVADGELRIGVTITDSTDVIEDRILAATLETRSEWGNPDRVPPT